MNEPFGRHTYSQFVERCAVAAEAESSNARALRWRHASFDERARAGIELMRVAELAVLGRTDPYVKPPLPVVFRPDGQK